MRVVKKDNKGFTLVELLVSIAILGILTAAAMGFLVSGTRIFSSVSASTGLQYESQTVMSQMQNRIIDCNGGVWFDDATDTLYVINLNTDGTLSIHSFKLAGGVFSYTAPDNSSATVSKRVTEMDATLTVEDGAVSKLELTLTFERRGKTYTGSQEIYLRNLPITSGSLNDLTDALDTSEEG